MQPTNDSKKTALMVGAVALVIGGLGGFGITKAMDNTDSSNNMSMSESSQTSTAKASDLRSSLVTLGVEHMNLTDQAVADALDGSPAAAETSAALYKNGETLGATVGSVYGKDAETTFNTVWKLHLDEFVNYAVAGSKNDDAGKQKALASIQTNYTAPLAAYLAKANPNLPEATLQEGLAMHVDMTAKMIDLHNAKDYKGEAAQLAAANTHIAGLFSTLAGGIAKQFPEKFGN